MSRPEGSETITLDDLRKAAATVRHRIGPDASLPQTAVATEAGRSEAGLRDWHNRRGLTWPECAAVLEGYSAVPPRSDTGWTREDSAMRSLLVPLDPDTADRLRELAQADRRHPRDEAALLLAEAVRRRAAKRPRLAPVA